MLSFFVPLIHCVRRRRSRRHGPPSYLSWTMSIWGWWIFGQIFAETVILESWTYMIAVPGKQLHHLNHSSTPCPILHQVKRVGAGENRKPLFCKRNVLNQACPWDLYMKCRADQLHSLDWVHLQKYQILYLWWLALARLHVEYQMRSM